ncbi:hypothetical protein OIU77_028853 [Salix suchowensis]|uniref:Alpha/beta hydrolase fold-3 domain-containing protein n=1 Tax=Salix suchowensis TaxID=1278906 RepID=A0ABQ9BIV0_9ROSI|nr:hypothetical protein OIU77_028853 [Salix suchowensis]
MGSNEVASNEVDRKFRFLTAYKDGRVEIHYSTQKTPPSNDPNTGVQSKDVTISTEPPVSARIYLPKIIDPTQKVPVLYYIHGGGFCFESAFSPLFHSHLMALVAEANVIAVSLEYGLWPERPLPGSYVDAWAGLQWIASHIGSYGLPGVRFIGMIMVHPFFGGMEDDEMWMFMYPTNCGKQDPKLKPPPEDLAKLTCEKVLFFFAEKDHLREVGGIFSDDLKKSGYKGAVEVVEHDGVAHEFHLFDPAHDKSTSEVMLDFDIHKLKTPSLSFSAFAEKDHLREVGGIFSDDLKKSGYKGAVEVVEHDGVAHEFHLFDPAHDKSTSLVKKFASFLNEV